MVKTCSGCKKILPYEEFYKNKSAKDGYQWHCKDCRKSIQNKHYSNPDNKERLRKYQKEWSKNNPDKKRKSKLKTRYGISLEEYERMYKKLRGICPMCERKFKTLCVDHCHDTGKIRGLLCTSCNLILGYAYNKKETLKNGAKYLTGEKECG